MWLACFLLAVAISPAGADVPPPMPDWVPRLISTEEAASGFYPLYNGSDLDGWVVTGAHKGVFSARGDILAVGGTGDGGWLVTEDLYDYFVLRYEFRTGTGKSAKNRDVTEVRESRQLAVDLASVPDAASGEWNDVEVVCEAGRMQATVNDVQVAEGRAKPGRIGIQDCGLQMEFRKVRIRPLRGGSHWRRWESKSGDVLPESFDLRFRFKPSGDSRGAAVFLSKKGRPLFDVRIGNGAAEAFTGSIGETAEALELRAFDDCWNHMRISVDGSNITVWVNGKTVVDFISTRGISCAGGTLSFAVERGSIEFEDIEINAKE